MEDWSLGLGWGLDRRVDWREDVVFVSVSVFVFVVG